MDDPLFDDGAVQIVGAESQGDLRQRWCERDPIRFDVWKVVQHQARDRNRHQVVHTGRCGQVSVNRVLGMKCQRDETIEAASLILELA